MKQLTLELNKRLLIVEVEENELEEFSKRKYYFGYEGKNPIKLICKGDELTEDIAKGFFDTALESFISAIEAKGWRFGNNPYKNDLDKCNEYTDMFTIAKRTRAYEEYDFRNFNPEKTIIFEIL